jgi:glucan 1,3-beta-glucosidase
MRTKPLTGVNLGGWLVLEKWITPGLFQGTGAKDEYTFCEHAGAKELQRLKQFRDTFITKQDFVWLAAHGVQAVRLPIGYWAFGGAKPYLPTVGYIDKAFKWAQATGIRILIDLHGAPGSQNGRDHSGRAGKTGWHHDPRNITATLDAVSQIAKRYGSHPALLGISLLNEPMATIPKATLLDFYKQAYATIRKLCGDRVWIVYSDGYTPIRWRKELPRRQFHNVYIDTHHYQIFSPIDKLLPSWLNLLRTRWQLPRALTRLRKYHPVIIGEWSLTLGSTRLGKQIATRRRAVHQAYGRLQLSAYQPTDAWFFWTYKTEHGGTWSFRDCVEKDLLLWPQHGN